MSLCWLSWHQKTILNFYLHLNSTAEFPQNVWPVATVLGAPISLAMEEVAVRVGHRVLLYVGDKGWQKTPSLPMYWSWKSPKKNVFKFKLILFFHTVKFYFIFVIISVSVVYSKKTFKELCLKCFSVQKRHDNSAHNSMVLHYLMKYYLCPWE